MLTAGPLLDVLMTEWSPLAVKMTWSILPSLSTVVSKCGDFTNTLPLRVKSSPATNSNFKLAETVPLMLKLPPVWKITVSELITLGRARVIWVVASPNWK